MDWLQNACVPKTSSVLIWLKNRVAHGAMIVLLWFLLRLLPSLFNSTTGRLEAENAALRHQLIARRRTTLPDPRPERDLRRSRHTPATRHGHPRQSRLLQARRGRMRYAVRRIGTIRRERVEAH